jgi:N4-gp56 family major capsid protein
MAKTSVATDNALTQKLWDEQLFRDTKKESYFDRFMAKGPNSIVQVKTALEKKKGDKITFGIRMRLSGAGQTEGGVLEGNEEKLTTYDHSITLGRYRHAVRDAGELDRQRPIYDMDDEARQALSDWGSEKIDQLAMDALVASPSKIFYGGTATSTATVTAAGLITPAIISKIRVWALTGGARSQTPLRPIKINGKKYFVLLVHPDVMYDLKQDSTFAQARREALERGKDNPIFSGSEAMWDNVVVHEHENVPIVTNWGSGSNVAGAKCSLMGAQSLVWAWGKRPKVVAKTFDYDEEHGFGWGMTSKVNKPVFNSLDYGSIAVYVARTQISDA